MFLSTDLITRLEPITIVLVEPQGALNLGSIARVMKNMGLSRLTLVDPQCDPLGEEARRMAVHAFGLLEQARIVATIPEAIAAVTRTIATTGRNRSSSVETPLLPPEIGLPWLLDTPSALLFGPEDRGLSNEELAYAQRFVSIPSTEAYPSLNLAQAVAVCARDLVRAAEVEGIGDRETAPLIPPTPARSTIAHSSDSDPDANAAPIGQLEGYYKHLEQVLLEIGYLQPHTASARMEKFRRLFNRSQLSSQEVAMLRGILRQVEWASQASIAKPSETD
ncbi:MAG: RNA methyltransferase [Oscillatoriales cyanobacterium]|nr:MAG: RNA methyltransferase [Oscillatoriales cyanobacterium]